MTVFQYFLEQWQLRPDGQPIITPSSYLLPVLAGDEKAMLKVATIAEEKCGARLMRWWNGAGAARILRYSEDAILLERATSEQSLAALDDNTATVIMCRLLAELHRPRQAPLPELVALNEWFKDLITEPHSGVLARSAQAARHLLATADECIPLHGDIHHGNILHFGERGWQVIDPKGLLGERGFDYANWFCNPDFSRAISPGRMRRQVDVVAQCAGLDVARLLQWILAWAGLSAIWFAQDGASASAEARQRIALLAADELDNYHASLQASASQR